MARLTLGLRLRQESQATATCRRLRGSSTDERLGGMGTGTDGLDDVGSSCRRS